MIRIDQRDIDLARGGDPRPAPVAVLAMEHGKVNALDLELLDGLARAFDDVRRSEAVALILTGRGSIFSAGVDLKRILDGGREYVEDFLPALQKVFHDLLTFPRPTVAAINGHAIAGGCVLALACDWRVMAEGPGRIGVPELQVGVPFPVLALEILRAAVPRQVLGDLVFGGETLRVGEARRLGLIDETGEEHDLLDLALADAERLARIPTASFRLTREQLLRPVLAAWERTEGREDARVLEAWCSKPVRDAIERYVEATFGGKKS